jgi:hypothetical protein
MSKECVGVGVLMNLRRTSAKEERDAKEMMMMMMRNKRKKEITEKNDSPDIHQISDQNVWQSRKLEHQSGIENSQQNGTELAHHCRTR